MVERESARTLRWRIMVGIGADGDGRVLNPIMSKQSVIAIANQNLTSFSVTDGFGVWNGQEEPSLVVEVIGWWEDRDAVHKVAALICKQLNQEEVWITEEKVKLTRYCRT